MKLPRARLLLVWFCTVASGLLGWLLLFAAWSGNWWAVAGWAFGITTAVAVIPWVSEIKDGSEDRR